MEIKVKKIAVVTDVMMRFGGAELVTENILELYPSADFYTLMIAPEMRNKLKLKFPKLNINTSWFQLLIRGNSVTKYISIIKLLSWIYWEFLDLKKYDLVISSSHSYMSKNVKRGKDAFHLSYIHTPPRYLYDEYSEIDWLRNRPWNWLFWPFKMLLRMIDKKGSGRPDVMVANSYNVNKRIRKYYNRGSLVIYPPIEIDQRIEINKSIPKKDYYVCLSRLVKQKGIDLVVKACSKIKKPLVVIGNGDELANLKKMANKNIIFENNCDDKRKFQILSGSRGLIYTSKDEDFGMVPVEAMALGVPVIAYKSGGVLETVIDGKTGLLFDDYSVGGLVEAIKNFENHTYKAVDCIKQAIGFNQKVFRKKFLVVVGKSEKNSKLLIGNIYISNLDLSTTIDKIFKSRHGMKIYCCTMNEVVTASKDVKYQKLLNNADLLTPDGMPLVWWLRLHGYKAQRVYGPELMQRFLKINSIYKQRLIFIGDNKNRNYFKNYGNYLSLPFKEKFNLKDYKNIVKEIVKVRAKVVWIGLGAKKQIVVADRLYKLLPNRVYITVGAAFDFLSGNKKQAPKWLRQIGGEWLFRLVSEPKRLGKRYFKIIRFLVKKIFKFRVGKVSFGVE